MLIRERDDDDDYIFISKARKLAYVTQKECNNCKETYLVVQSGGHT